LELLEDVAEHGADELIDGAAVAGAVGDEALARGLEDGVDLLAVAGLVDLDQGLLDGADRPLARLGEVARDAGGPDDGELVAGGLEVLDAQALAARAGQDAHDLDARRRDGRVLAREAAVDADQVALHVEE